MKNEIKDVVQTMQVRFGSLADERVLKTQIKVRSQLRLPYYRKLSKVS